MRTGSAKAAAVLLLVLGGAPTQGHATPFTAEIQIGLAGTSTPAVTGGGEGVSQPLTVALPADAVVGTTSVDGGDQTFIPGLTPVDLIQVEIANDAGSFTGNPLAGPMPLDGRVLVRAFVQTDVTVTMPLTVIGKGGTVTNPILDLWTAQLSGGPWTTGPIVVAANETLDGASTVGSTLTTTGSDARTPGGLGRLRMVSPVVLRTNIPVPGLGAVAGFATLTVDFVPEPVSAVLALTSITALTFLARRRRPHRS